MRSLSSITWLVVWLLCTAAWSAGAAELTDSDRAYAASLGKVSFCVDPDWEPFEIISPAGQHQGIAADLLRLVTGRAGLSLELVPTTDWDESIATSKAGQCTLLSFLNQTPKRDEWLLFTDPLFTDSNVFITREEHPFIIDPAILILAERIRQAVRNHDFDTGRRQTVSIGVATLGPSDDIDQLLNRADQALYIGKSSGRDRVCSEADLTDT